MLLHCFKFTNGNFYIMTKHANLLLLRQFREFLQHELFVISLLSNNYSIWRKMIPRGCKCKELFNQKPPLLQGYPRDLRIFNKSLLIFFCWYSEAWKLLCSLLNIRTEWKDVTPCCISLTKKWTVYRQQRRP